jgi:ubiquinone/menaquinone biosynthesis C-methylase UbiE
MNHNDHVSLIRNGVATSGGVWADFGAGTGAFTLALAEVVGPGAEIYGIILKNAGKQIELGTCLA